MPFNNVPCPEPMITTNIIIKPNSSEALFIFYPDIFTIPNQICPMDINIMGNNKGDLKISLLDDNQKPIYEFVLKCGQYDVQNIVESNTNEQTLIPERVRCLYNNFGNEKLYTEVLGVIGSNLQCIEEYIGLEEAAYMYRQVSQCYQNFWQPSEKRNGIMSYWIQSTKDIMKSINENKIESENIRQIWSFSQALIKSRVLAIKHIFNL